MADVLMDDVEAESEFEAMEDSDAISLIRNMKQNQCYEWKGK